MHPSLTYIRQAETAFKQEQWPLAAFALHKGLFALQQAPPPPSHQALVLSTALTQLRLLLTFPFLALAEEEQALLARARRAQRLWFTGRYRWSSYVETLAACLPLAQFAHAALSFAQAQHWPFWPSSPWPYVLHLSGQQMSLHGPADAPKALLWAWSCHLQGNAPLRRAFRQAWAGGDLDQSRFILAQLIQQDPSKAKFYYWYLARANRLTGDWALALEALLKAQACGLIRPKIRRLIRGLALRLYRAAKTKAERRRYGALLR